MLKLKTRRREAGLTLQVPDAAAESSPAQREPRIDQMGTAEVLGTRETGPGVFCVEVRCPYCLCMHLHHVAAADLDELRGHDEVPRWRHCTALGTHIMGVPKRYDLLAYKLRGFADLDDSGLHSDLESADPHGFFFTGPYDAPARITSAVSLLRAAGGLKGFDIEHFHPTPVAKLVRQEEDGVQRDVLMLTVQPTDTDEAQAITRDGALQLVLQRHRFIDGRHIHTPHHDVLTYDDPGHLLRAVYEWTQDT